MNNYTSTLKQKKMLRLSLIPSSNMVISYFTKKECGMNKPIAVGFTIFLSKLQSKIVKPTAIGLFIQHSILVKYKITIIDEGIKLWSNIFCNHYFRKKS